MPSRDEFISAVSAFLAAPKALIGADSPQQWQPSRTRPEQCIKVPVEIDGVQYGHQLVVVAPSGRSEFSISLVFNVGISRLDFEHGGGHRNTLFASADGLPMVVSGMHFHRWSYNTRFVEGDGRLEELKHAEDLPGTIHTFDAALRFFCHETNIQLPHGHHIELPRTLI